MIDKTEVSFNYNVELIQGDNVDVMEQWGDRKRPNIVYLDPPYNTKNPKLTYTDRMATDSWREFFHKRASAAQRIMDKNSVIFVSISMDELANAILTMDSVFGPSNRVSVMPRLTHKGHKTSKTITNIHDYLLIYRKGLVEFNGLDLKQSAYKHKDEHFEKRGLYQLRRLDYKDFKYSPGHDFEIEYKDSSFVPGVNKETFDSRKTSNSEFDWCWLWSKERVKFAIENDFLEFKGTKVMKKTYTKAKIAQGVPKLQYFERARQFNSLSLTETWYANNKMDDEFSGLFTYPKSPHLLQTIFNWPKFKEKVILDAFAGSAVSAGILEDIEGVSDLFLIQIDEKVKPDSSADKAGFKSIFEITKKIVKSSNPNVKVVKHG